MTARQKPLQALEVRLALPDLRTKLCIPNPEPEPLTDRDTMVNLLNGKQAPVRNRVC